jgi:hypothetical protein
MQFGGTKIFCIRGKKNLDENEFKGKKISREEAAF